MPRRRHVCTTALVVICACLSVPSGAPAAPGWATPAATLTNPGGSQLQPHVAADAQGDSVVVWSDASGNVFESDRPAGGSFSPAEQISTAAGQQFSSVAIDESGLIYIFFVTESGSAANMQPNVATKPVGGSTWTITPLAAKSGSDPPGSPLVGAVTPSGKAIAVWYQGHTAGNQLSKFEFATKPAGSSTWSAKAEVSNTGDQGNSTSPSSPALAVDPSGDAALVYSRFDSGFVNRVVWGTTLTAGAASWTVANPISTDVGSDTLEGQPVVAVGPNGAATAAWIRKNNAPNNIVQFATKTLAEGSWPVAPSGNSITPGANDLSPLGSDASQPVTAIEPDGTTTIAWSQANTTLMERTRPASGGSFNPATTLATTLTSPTVPVLSAASDGSMVAAWSGQNGSAASVISMARRTRGAASFTGLPDLPGVGNSMPAISSDNQDNVATGWVHSPEPGQYQDQATALVIGPPTITNVLFPATGIAGIPFSYSAMVSDRWTTAVSSWSFGDGTTGPAGGTKTYGAAGAYSPTLTATDPFGNIATAHASIAVALAPVTPVTHAVVPAITAVRQSTSKWREGGKLAQISRRKRPPVGTTFSFSLNEQASVRFNFTSQVPGRQVHRRCVAKTRKNAKRKSCKRSLTAGTLTFTGHAGRNKVVFQGRISPSKKLKRGRYTLVVTATTSSGTSSSPSSLTFTIVK